MLSPSKKKIIIDSGTSFPSGAPFLPPGPSLYLFPPPVVGTFSPASLLTKLRLLGPPVCPAPDVTVGLQRPAGFRLPIGPRRLGLRSPPMTAAQGWGVPTSKMAPPGAGSG